MPKLGKGRKTADVATKYDKPKGGAHESNSEQLEQSARKAIRDASLAFVNIDLFDDIIPTSDSEIQWPDYGSVKVTFEALAEHGMAHALIRLSDELMLDTGMRSGDWIASEISRCLDVARSAVMASNMNVARKNAFLHRVKKWKSDRLMRSRHARPG